MYVAVREPFGRHVVEVVRGLHETPYIVEIGAFQGGDLLFLGVEFRESLVLQLVAEPRRHVALLVGPRHYVRTVEYGHRLVLLGGLAYGGELHIVLLGEDRFGKRTHEFEDSRIRRLMLPEGLVVHEKVDDLARRFVRREPFDVFVRRQRPFVPAAVRETERNVVRELVVAQQQAQFLIDGVGIDVVRRFPAQHVLGAFGQHRAEAHVGDHGADLVGVDQLGVAEGGGLHAELLLDHRRMELHLFGEILFRRQRRQRMGVGFGQKLDASRGGQLLERVEHLRREGAELLDGDARDRERTAEFTLVLLDQLQQQGVHGQVTLPGDFLHDRAVQEVV